MAKAYTDQQLAQINAQVAQDPEWLAARGGPDQYVQLQNAIKRATGGSIPDTYKIDVENGGLRRESWAKRHRVLGTLAAGAAGFAGGAAIGASMGGAAGGAAATGAGGAGATAAGTGAAAGGTGAALGSTSLATGSAAAGAGGLGAGAALPAGTAGASLAGGGTAAAAGGAGAATAGSRFANLAQQGGRAASAYGQAQAQNRGTQLQATMDQDQTRLSAERDRRAGEREAMAGLARTNYIQNWQPRASSVQGLPTYGFGPQAPSEAQRRGAATLEQTLLDRLDTGGFQPSDTSSLMQPGRGERFAGLLGAGLSAYGAYSGNRGASTAGNAISGMSNARPQSAAQGSATSMPQPSSSGTGGSPFVDQSGMDRWNNAITAGRQNIPVTQSMQVPIVDESLTMPVQNTYRDDIFQDQSGMGRWDEILRKYRGQR